MKELHTELFDSFQPAVVLQLETLHDGFQMIGNRPFFILPNTAPGRNSLDG